MKQLKKTILTLVALLAVTTGAWAQDPNAVTAAEINSEIYSGWSSIDGKLLKASDLPGFQAVTEDQAKSWTGVPSTGKVWLYYEFVADGNVKVIEFENGVYVESFEDNELECNLIWEDIKYNGDKKYFYTTGPAPSGPKVAWDKAKNTGSFTMPGGNVTLEPEYYPQATVADGGVTAADADARATTDDQLVKVDATKLTGAKKLMYFVSNSGTTAPAYDAEGWTDQLPTAEGFTQQGIVYVWYYPVGTDEGVDGATATYSDGDICLQSITARIAAAPTYAVTFAKGTDPNEWTATPNAGVKKGTPVTVTYTGTKKVIGVKAEKKSAAAAPRPLAEAVAADLGKIAGADGNIYDTKAAAEAVATGNAVAMIAYVGSASDCTHGLAIALADESGTKTWSEAGAACSGKTAVTGGTWRLPSIKDWQYMFIGCGASGSYSDSPSTMSYSELATKLTTANGTALQTLSYWSSTESSPGEDAWSLYFGGSSASFFSGDYEGGAYPIRACLAF